MVVEAALVVSLPLHQQAAAALVFLDRVAMLLVQRLERQEQTAGLLGLLPPLAAFKRRLAVEPVLAVRRTGTALQADRLFLVAVAGARVGAKALFHLTQRAVLAGSHAQPNLTHLQT